MSPEHRSWLEQTEPQSPRCLVWLMAWAAVVVMGVVAVWHFNF